MKCHYDILGLTQEASDEEIKKSYRKLALQWHPDKNPDNIDECTRQFHLIQAAYEVLIDPQERAWYDKHRDAILRGGLGHGDKYEDKSLDVYEFFNSSCYSGFGNDDKGFFAVYGEVFKKISIEDQEYADGVNETPVFGDSQSIYEEVVGSFYAYWESYSTAKSYVWVEQYDTREAPNRQIRRLMEQDNKKLRDKARRERNEEVRALVAYVRKRDPRVQAYKKKLEERAVEIARLAEDKKKRDRQQRLKKLENYKESSWSSMSELEHQLKQLEVHVAEQFGDDDSSDYISEEEIMPDDNCQAAADVVDGQAEDATLLDDLTAMYADSLYCIACKKAFKSQKALDNHSKSKKHLDNVSQLQMQMADDDELMAAVKDDDNDISDDDDDDNQPVDDSETPQRDINDSRSKSKKQKKKRRQMLKVQTPTECDNSQHDGNNEDKMTSTPADHGAERNCLEEDRLSHSVADQDASVNGSAANETVDGNLSRTTEDSQLKSKSKNVKSAKPNIISGQSKQSAVNCQQSTDSQHTSASSLDCNTCRKTFSSRNKMFEHIKSTGHALRVDDVGELDTASRTKSKKGRRK